MSDANTVNEVWKAIPGYEGVYEISSEGNLRSLDRITKFTTRHGTPGTREFKGKDLKTKFNKTTGRNEITLWGRENGKKKCRTFPIHKLIMLAFAGPRPDGMCACHNDGDKTNDKLENLRYDSYKNNSLDKKKHGTELSGEARHNSSLTDKETREIVELYLTGEYTQAEICEKYGVGRKVLGNVINGRKDYYKDLIPSKEFMAETKAKILTWENVREMRRIYESQSITYSALAAQFNISRKTAASVIKELTWKSEKDPQNFQ